MKNVLFLIPARSGSKSVPDKNIKMLNGKPLLAYRIEQALTLTTSDNVWLSTDSAEYASIGTDYGATIPYLRPKELASDESSSIDVVLHAMNYANELSKQYELIALLEPTSPFVGNAQLSEAISLLSANQTADAIVATKEVHTNSVFIQSEGEYLTEMYKKIATLSSLRRQEQPRQITPSGGFYISKWDRFLMNKTFYTSKTLSYLLPDRMALEIDNPMDFKWAEFLISQKEN